MNSRLVTDTIREDLTSIAAEGLPYDDASSSLLEGHRTLDLETSSPKGLKFQANVRNKPNLFKTAKENDQYSPLGVNYMPTTSDSLESKMLFDSA